MVGDETLYESGIIDSGKWELCFRYSSIYRYRTLIDQPFSDFNLRYVHFLAPSMEFDFDTQMKAGVIIYT